MRSAGVIVIAEVTTVDDTAEDQSRVSLKPEAFLKGPPSAATLVLVKGLPVPCEARGPRAGQRILALLDGAAASPTWPSPERLFFFEGGQAISAIRGAPARGEADLVEQIRSQTNQFSRPAASDSDGAGIDWGSTVIPIAAACVGLMVVGLFLMRIWHRIDPS